MSEQSYLVSPPLGSPLYYAIRFAPSDYHHALQLIYSVYQTIYNITHVSDPNLALIKLQWWKQDIDRLYHHQAEHPLLQVIDPQDYERDAWDQLLALVQMEIEQNRYQNRTELHEYLGLYGQSFFFLLAQACGLHQIGQHEAQQIALLGESYRLAQMLIEVGLDARRGYIYLPLDQLKQANIKPAHILHHQANLSTILQEWSATASQHLNIALREISALPRAQTACIRILGHIARQQLQKLAKKHYCSLTHQIELSPFQLTWTAWKHS